ncbi:MAG: LamG domain-containing protein [bacterium]|nr:LamG domain-containing protein [bacterium]
MRTKKSKTKTRVKIQTHTVVLVVSMLIATFGIGYGFGFFRFQTKITATLSTDVCVNRVGGLVSWWDADSLQVNLAIDIADGADATLEGDVAMKPGKVGNAFSFFGPNGIITAPNRAEFTDNELTVEAWIRIEAMDDNRIIVAKGAFTEEPSWFFMATPGGGLIFRVYENESNYIDLSVGNVLLKSTWTHVAATYNTKSHEQKILINGQSISGSIAKKGDDVVSIFDSSEPLTIGRDRVGFVSQAPAYIDEIKIYNRVLSDSEIQSIVQAGVRGTCKVGSSCITPPVGLLNWWDADLTNAGVVTDRMAHEDADMQGGVGLASGKVGNAFQFDGVNDVVVSSNSMGYFLSAITVGAWVKPDSLGSSMATILSKDTPYDTQSSWLLSSFEHGRLRFDVYEGPVVARTLKTVKPVIFTGVWSHVVAVFNSETQDIAVYINGVRETDVTIAGESVYTIFNGTAPVRIGAKGPSQNLNGAQAFWSGWIDEVITSSRVLQGAEIGSIFEAGTHGMCKSGGGR